MRIAAGIENLEQTLQGSVGQIQRATTGAMREATVMLKDELRAQMRAAGLGGRLPNSWQGKTYPDGGNSLDPAGFVWSKAPKIADFFSKDSVVRARFGSFLAIPSENVPLGRGGRRMSVAEVEAKYGRRLVFIEPHDRGFRARTPSILRHGVAYLVLKGLVIRKSSQRYRNPTSREVARGRATQDVIMFTLVPQVVGRKKLDIEGAAQRAAAAVPGLVEKYLAEGAAE